MLPWKFLGEDPSLSLPASDGITAISALFSHGLLSVSLVVLFCLLQRHLHWVSAHSNPV